MAHNKIDDQSGPTDGELVARVRSGDTHAFAQIHARYRHALLDFARRCLGNHRHEAEDVVQDAFIRAYQALVTTDREVELRPWLYRIVQNRAIDELRRPRRTMPLDEPQLDRRSFALEPDPRVREVLAELVADVVALPTRQREALVGQALDGVPHVELAQRLGTTVAGTKALVNRARSTVIAARDAREHGSLPVAA